MALVNLETYNSFPNIHAGNNSFRYSNDNGQTWFPVALNSGSYNIEDINGVLQIRLRPNKHTHKIIIGANHRTLRATLTLARTYRVNFNVDNSINTVLGFDRKIYTSDRTTDGYTEGENIVNIISINSILINSVIISGSYVNGSQQSTIYSFFPNVSPGMKIIQNPKNLVYLPVPMRTINRMSTYLTDQDRVPVDIRGEHLTIRFHLREV